MIQRTLNAISLFCGAGGMDVGFRDAGFNIQWANDYDKQACETYAKNFGDHVECGDIREYIPSLRKFKGVDCVFGGPPCQGFSVAGRMDAHDERSKLVHSFFDVVEAVQPSSFVMENVKSLGTLDKFRNVREELVRRATGMGYSIELLVLNAKDFGVPQSRERMFLIGVRGTVPSVPLATLVHQFRCKSPTVREAIAHLGPAGSALNPTKVKAKITIAKRPILRKSPYAGMLFNGQGRPVDPDSYSSTMHASMGGNRTPIIDEEQLYHGKEGWVIGYHRHLVNGGESYGMYDAPPRLRRLTVDEARILQTFPDDYEFIGSQSTQFRQIGNAVPPKLAKAVANLVHGLLTGTLISPSEKSVSRTLELEF